MLSRKNRGFTLVEILIVVIILGILAAIVIPQFTNASQEARQSSLVSQLQTLRSQIELYKLQHGDTLPNLIAGGAAQFGQASGWDQLTKVTTYNGTNCGPYMQAVPVNPLTNSSVVVDGNETSTGVVGGFIYDYSTSTPPTGRIWGVDAAGNPVH